MTPRFLLIDISNSFTKAAWSDGAGIGGVHRHPTGDLGPEFFEKHFASLEKYPAILSSVVPYATEVIRELKVAKLWEISPALPLGIEIDYPHPSQIGADRLANAVACSALYGCPSVVVDFGTAVTFDVISRTGAYVGGVIAPGLQSMTTYLHEKTALLPRIRLEEPARVVGRSTREAMLSGAVFGYRGLIRELLEEIRREAFRGEAGRIVATGGDARLIAGSVGLFDEVDPLLTLHGLRLIGLRLEEQESSSVR